MDVQTLRKIGQDVAWHLGTEWSSTVEVEDDRVVLSKINADPQYQVELRMSAVSSKSSILIVGRFPRAEDGISFVDRCVRPPHLNVSPKKSPRSIATLIQTDLLPGYNKMFVDGVAERDVWNHKIRRRQQIADRLAALLNAEEEDGEIYSVKHPSPGCGKLESLKVNVTSGSVNLEMNGLTPEATEAMLRVWLAASPPVRTLEQGDHSGPR